MSHLPPQLLKRFYSHLNSAVAILQAYRCDMPFTHFIKSYFSLHKKFGSKDRKQISELCYCYFRLGRSYPLLSIEKKIIKGYQLSQKKWSPEWEHFFENAQLPNQTPDNIFPFLEHLSDAIDVDVFLSSHLIQPDLFLRIRPGYTQLVIEKLQAANISFERLNNALRLHNSVQLIDKLELNKEVVVQDLSSQQVSELLHLYQSFQPSQKHISVWDCCAASGGKSILAYDILSQIQLTVSDIRPSIISNLKKRLKQAQIAQYQTWVVDAAQVQLNKKFDLIIADVPCSGSGTWARNPEQLQCFEANRIQEFVLLQHRIVQNAIKHLKPGGYLLYITCSVFYAENEQQIQTLCQQGFQAVEQRYFKGYYQNADTMFAALLTRSKSDSV